MGCGPSKPPSRQQQHNVTRVIGAPQNVQIHIPRNRADQNGLPLKQVTREIDSNTLLAALNHVSAYIRQQRQHISVVVVGGAVNTLYLRSRSTTHDVDIFGSDFNNQARILLDVAMQEAQEHYPGLGTDWLNTETQMWMPGPMHHELTVGARQQNVKVFDSAGLTIYAAPWEYAFSAKISWILKPGNQARLYDLEDAITYIHEYIRGHGKQPVPVTTALEWSRRYQHETSKSFLHSHLNKEYRMRYCVNAFV